MTPDRLVYRCRSCRRVISDGKGSVHISYDEINRAEDASDAWERRRRDLAAANNGVVTLSDVPDHAPAHWTAHHDQCHPDEADYAIPVERMRTHEEMLAWTAHLLGKAWLHHTNWEQFIYSMISNEAMHV